MGFDSLILVVHVVIVLAMIVLILIQRNASDGLSGIGGNSTGNMTSSKSAANFLTKMTTYLAIGFFATSLSLAIIAANDKDESITDTIKAKQEQQTPAADAPVTNVPIAE